MAQSLTSGTKNSKEAYNLAIDYVRFRLREECSTDPSFERQMDYLHADYCLPPLETERKYRVLRALARTVERRYTSTFNDMCKRLRIEKSTAATTFHTVVNELFQDGVNWGRIGAVYGFAGSLAVHLVKRGYRDLLAFIPRWVSSYVDSNLKDWIADHKGWDGFVKHFGEKFGEQADSRDNKGIWNRMAAVGGVLAGLAVVGFALKS